MLTLLLTAAALSPPQVLTGAKARRACQPAALLCAEAILAAEDGVERAILASALSRDLSQRMSGEAMLVTLDDDDGELIGCCAIEVCMLSPAALDMRRVGRGADVEFDVCSRPLLSSLAVSSRFRKKGLGMALCREAEAWAKAEGFDEILLKVEQDNRRARNLYRKLGYRDVAVDKQAERPVASCSGLKFVPTVQVAMRKDLTRPPLDSILKPLALIAAGCYLQAEDGEQLSHALSLLQGGQAADALNILLGLLPAVGQ